jgi:diketogulonate reductase-like aldo/keto reductase
VAVLVNVPLGNGGLVSKMNKQPLPGWAGEVGATTWAQLLLKFVISHPAVTTAIPATRNPKHMIENAIAGQGAVLSTAQRNAMIAAFEKA